MPTRTAGRPIGALIDVYLRSPLHPRLSKPLRKALDRYMVLRGTREQVVDTGRFKIRCNPRDFIESRVLLTGEWEPATVRTLERVVKPGMTCFDVGANVGCITMTLAALTESAGRVFALEPSDYTYERLLYNIRLNDFDWVTAERYAIGRQSQDEVIINLPRGFRLDGKFTSREQTIPMTSLDDYVANRSIERVDFIKSDTDGMEQEVFAGARAVLERDRPTLLFEVHPAWLERKNSSPGELFGTLDGLGYSFTDEGGEPISDPIAAAAKVVKELSVNLVAVARRTSGHLS